MTRAWCVLMALLWAAPAWATVTPVHAADNDLQAKINAAACADTLVLDDDGVWTGPYYLPNKSCTGPGFTTITRSGTLPADCDPNVKTCRDNWVANHAHQPRINRAGSYGAIFANHSAGWWKLEGLEIADPSITPSDANSLIILGECGNSCGAYNYSHTSAEQPHDFAFNHLYLHGTADGGVQSALTSTGSNIRLTYSYIDQIKNQSLESFGFYHQTDGPVDVLYNYIADAGIGVFIGDNDVLLPAPSLPNHVTIEHNYITKRCEWFPSAARVGCTYDGHAWIVKNSLEVKRGTDITIRYNTIEKSWDHGQNGLVVLMQMYAAEAKGCFGCFKTFGSTGAGYLVNNGGGYPVAPPGSCPLGITGTTTINVDTGAGTMNAGEFLHFQHQTACATTYKIISSTGSPVTSVTFQPALVESLLDNEQVDVVGAGLDCTWCTISNVIVKYNVIRHGAEGFAAIGRKGPDHGINPIMTAPISDGLDVEENLFYDITDTWSTGDTSQLDCFRPEQGWKNVTFRHNTCDNNGLTSVFCCTAGLVLSNTPAVVGEVNTNLTFKDSFFISNQYGLNGDGGLGTPALNTAAPGPTWTWQQMVLTPHTAGGVVTYPPGTDVITPSAFAAIFVDRATGSTDDNVDYRVKPGSVYKAGGAFQASDGLDIGVTNFALLPDPAGGAVVVSAPPTGPIRLRRR